MRAGLLLPVCMSGSIVFAAAAGCGGGGNDKKVNSEDGVELLYEDFQVTIAKITSAGLAAKDASTTGANIDEAIELVGLVSGTGAVGGSVAQSTGQNENLNLWVELNDYSDTGDITYQTDNTSDTTKLQFDLNIKNQNPDNFMSGILTGTLIVSGDVDGTGLFNLTTATDLEDDDGNPAVICTHVTGTVTAEGDQVTVDFVLPLTLDSALNAACSQL